MHARPQCPKGHGTMTKGFEIDHKDGYRTVAGWVAGEPEGSRWFPVRMKGRKPVPIVTWRCNHCGLLESYAPSSG